MVGNALGLSAWRQVASGAIPTTCPWATRPHDGASLAGSVAVGPDVPPLRGLVGLRQVDGTAPRIADEVGANPERAAQERMSRDGTAAQRAQGGIGRQPTRRPIRVRDEEVVSRLSSHHGTLSRGHWL
jgi:hypothetical protein